MSNLWTEQVSKAELELVHGPFIPASVYSGMGISGTLCSNDRDVPLRIWRLSPQGMEFEWTQDLDFQMGQAIFMKICINNQVIAYHAIVVSAMHHERELRLVGVKYESRLRSEKPTNGQREARLHKRWDVNKRYYPTGVAPSPLAFYGNILFTVADVSSAGMRLFTSLRNKFLIPGLILKAKIYFPPVGHIEIKMMIRNVNVVHEGSDLLQVVGAQILERDKDFSRAVGQYILQFGQGHEPVCETEVHKQELDFHETASLIDWGFAETTQDREQVEALCQAALCRGKPACNASGADFDAHSRILLGRFRGVAVASMRLMFCSTDDDRFAAENHFELPRALGVRREMVEFSSLCTHEDFSGTELTVGLIRFAFFLILQSGRRYALCACEDINLQTFCRWGFKDTGMAAKTATVGARPLRLLVADVQKIVAGQHVGPMAWNKMFRGREEYLQPHHESKNGLQDTVRLAAYRVFGPLSDLAEELKRRKQPVKYT